MQLTALHGFADNLCQALASLGARFLNSFMGKKGLRTRPMVFTDVNIAELRQNLRTLPSALLSREMSGTHNPERKKTERLLMIA